MHFIHTFLLYCLLVPSPKVNEEEKKNIQENQNLVALSGRNLRIRLDIGKKLIQEKDALQHILSGMKTAAGILDKVFQCKSYSDSLAHFFKISKDYNLIPSSRIFQTLERRKEELFQVLLSRSKVIQSQLLRKEPRKDLTN